jgi:hypothetical protein
MHCYPLVTVCKLNLNLFLPLSLFKHTHAVHVGGRVRKQLIMDCERQCRDTDNMRNVLIRFVNSTRVCFPNPRSHIHVPITTATTIHSVTVITKSLNHTMCSPLSAVVVPSNWNNKHVDTACNEENIKILRYILGCPLNYTKAITKTEACWNYAFVPRRQAHSLRVDKATPCELLRE